ncbi:MAG: FtsW/RodA/SpoVE family cell cycle protein [bacterium]
MSTSGNVVRINREINWIVLVGSSILLSVGFISLYSIEKIQLITLDRTDVPLKAQFIYTFIGLACAFIGYRFRLKILEMFARWIYLASLALLILTYFFGTSVNGGVRWVTLFGFSVQSGDIARLALIICLGSVFKRKKVDLGIDVIKALLCIVITTVLILFQPDFGSAVITFLTGILMLFILGIPLSLFSLIIVPSAYIGYKLIFKASYREARFLAFLNPWKDPLGNGYQYIQAILGFARGGLTGVGLGLGRQKLAILPEVHTDLILAHIGEELGFIFTFFVICVYAFIGINMLKVGKECPLRFTGNVIVGFAISFMLQALLNIAGELKLLPIIGVPLPLLSSGGTSRIVTLFMIGYTLGASRYGLVKEKDEKNSNSSWRQWRTLVSSHSVK